MRYNELDILNMIIQTSKLANRIRCYLNLLKTSIEKVWATLDLVTYYQKNILIITSIQISILIDTFDKR